MLYGCDGLQLYANYRPHSNRVICWAVQIDKNESKLYQPRFNLAQKCKIHKLNSRNNLIGCQYVASSGDTIIIQHPLASIEHQPVPFHSDMHELVLANFEKSKKKKQHNTSGQSNAHNKASWHQHHPTSLLFFPFMFLFSYLLLLQLQIRQFFHVHVNNTCSHDRDQMYANANASM